MEPIKIKYHDHTWTVWGDGLLVFTRRSDRALPAGSLSSAGLATGDVLPLPVVLAMTALYLHPDDPPLGEK